MALLTNLTICPSFDQAKKNFCLGAENNPHKFAYLRHLYMRIVERGPKDISLDLHYLSYCEVLFRGHESGDIQNLFD